MLRFSTFVILALSSAPVQCPSRTPHEARREESPGEALWNLSERFDAEGNRQARDRTLRYLIERYPSSRFAARARDLLTDDAGR